MLMIIGYSLLDWRTWRVIQGFYKVKAINLNIWKDRGMLCVGTVCNREIERSRLQAAPTD